MPCHSVTLPDIEQSVARPAIFKILEQIFDITKLSKDTEIYYHGKTSVIQTPGTSIDDNSRDAKFAASRYTFVEVNESYQLGAMQEIHVHSNEHAPVFRDAAIGISLRPVYTTSDVVINIRYRANSETEVRRWMSDMLMKTARGRDINLHDITYTYPLPYPLVELIEDIWTLREATAGYGDSFQEYIIDKGTDRLTMLANRAGQMRHLAVKETQTRIIGMFDFAGVPEAPVRDSSTGTWELSFAYKFSYQRPDAVVVDYPIAVHNQFLPEKYLDQYKKEIDPMLRKTYYSSSYEALSLFEGDKIAMDTRPPRPYIRIPEFDDFKIPSPFLGTGTVFTALCFLEEDGRVLLNLKELGDFVIDEDIMEFMQGEVSYMNKLYHSFFHVCVYENDKPISFEKIEILSDFTVRAVAPLDPRKIYRVRFAMVIDLKLLLWAAIQRLSNYPKAFVKMLAALNELLRLNPDFVKLMDRRIEPWHLSYAYWVLTGGANSANASYLWNDKNGSGGFTGKTGDRFIGSIDKKTLDEYFRMKRRNMLTVQNVGIIVRPIHHHEEDYREVSA